MPLVLDAPWSAPATSTGTHRAHRHVPREADGDGTILAVGDDGRPCRRPEADVLRRAGVDGLIRIRDADMPWVPTAPGTRFAVANLQVSGHVPGVVYGLPRIRAHGWFRPPADEVQPLLDVGRMPRARCVACRESIPHGQVRDDELALLFHPLRSHDRLRVAILRRYADSLPWLDAEVMVGLGVSITTLELLEPADA